MNFRQKKEHLLMFLNLKLIEERVKFPQNIEVFMIKGVQVSLNKIIGGHVFDHINKLSRLFI